MQSTDPIADMLTRIRNVNIAAGDVVEVPASKVKRELARILREEGFIRDFEIVKSKDGKKGTLKLYLRYGPNKTRVIAGLKRISKPGRRIYTRKNEVPKVLGGLGVAIISTPKGIMSDKEARKNGLGGEVICYVW
ncbi:MAG TPA: 30S ribosomal protein S8 [Firmicutes bacterium]|nr:30S ribosomal protein S8 [Bacillota bacterium]HHY98464.1 30S ribosomal protein S8 [Bacillota bacterium]